MTGGRGGVRRAREEVQEEAGEQGEEQQQDVQGEQLSTSWYATLMQQMFWYYSSRSLSGRATRMCALDPVGRDRHGTRTEPYPTSADNRLLLGELLPIS